MPHQETIIGTVWYPSVTTIMGAQPKPWLENWKAKWGILATRKTKIAEAIGSEFHRCVESWINTGTYDVQPPTVDGFAMPSTVSRVQGMVQSWLVWAKDVYGTVEHTELKVVSHTHTYSGTLDAVGTLDGKPMLFDWKTAPRIYSDYQLQLTAYAWAYNEQTGAKVKDGIIVCVSKEKPAFRCMVKRFKLGKQPFKQFLKLRREFESFSIKPNLDADSAQVV